MVLRRESKGLEAIVEVILRRKNINEVGLSILSEIKKIISAVDHLRDKDMAREKAKMREIIGAMKEQKSENAKGRRKEKEIDLDRDLLIRRKRRRKVVF